MRRAHSVDDVRAAERAAMAALPPGSLMARAAAGLATACVDVLGGVYGRRVVLLVGGGDNGGDALLAGAALARRGARVDALSVADRVHPAGAAALRAAGGRLAAAAAPGETTARVLGAAELVVDGVTGIGGSGPLRDHVAELLPLVGPDAFVVAVDVPSGVDADTGRVPGAHVRADVTVTFGAGKPGLYVDPGASAAGEVVEVDIGLDLDDVPPAVDVLAATDVRALLRPPVPTDDKYSRGVVGVAAGSARYPGAALLCVAGAQGTGAGMVRFVGSAEPSALVRHARPEALVTTGEIWFPGVLAEVGRVQAWAVGPGLGTDSAVLAGLRALLATGLPVVLDADAVTLVAQDPDLVSGRAAPTVLTPHAGELARVLGVGRERVEADRLASVRTAQQQLGVTVLLKGATTLVASGWAVRANPRATGWLASAGSGDVLTGVIGALLAHGLAPHAAASVGAWLHAEAGAAAAAGGPLRAAKVADALSGVIGRLLAGA